MNVRSILLVVVALAIAGAAALMARSLVREQPAEAKIVTVEKAADTAEVLVAAKPLPVGRLIEAVDIEWHPWPEDAVTDHFFTPEGTELESFVGKVVRHSIGPGEPITGVKVVGPGERGFLAAVLEPGMRAVTVGVNKTSGIAGFIFPGDKVDVILTHQVRVGEDEERQVSETVLYNVRVLATDTNTNDQANTPKVADTVTLEVTPKIAEKIAVVRTLGSLSLSLRSLAKQGEESEGPTLNPKFADARPSYTWDAEVSALLPKVGARRGIDVSRGADTKSVEVKGSVK